MIARAPSDYSCLLSLMSLSLSPTPQQTALTASLGLLHLVGTLTGREELYSFYTLIASFPSRTAISTPELSIALSLGCNPAIIPASWTFSSYCNSYVFFFASGLGEFLWDRDMSPGQLSRDPASFNFSFSDLSIYVFSHFFFLCLLF